MELSASHPAIVELTVVAPGPERRREPVTCGIPWPRGLLRDPAGLRLSDQGGSALPLQARALDRWPDGTVRWTLLDWQADVRGTAVYRLGVAEGAAAGPEGPRVRAESRQDE